MDKLNGSLESMNRNMSGMGTAIHSQTLAALLAAIMNPDSTRYVSMTSFNPLPMMPAAKGLAEAATAEELSSLFYLWITEINEATVDDGDNKAIDLHKMQLLCAMQAIAGMVSDDKITDMVSGYSVGRFDSGVRTLLVLRHSFISGFVLDSGILSRGIDNQDSYNSALLAIKSLQQIEELKFTPNLELHLTGFSDMQANQVVKIDGKTYKDYLVLIGNGPKKLQAR